MLALDCCFGCYLLPRGTLNWLFFGRHAVTKHSIYGTPHAPCQAAVLLNADNLLALLHLLI